MAKSGEVCENCRASRYVVSGRYAQGERVVQYLACKGCGHRPSDNKIIVLAESVHRRVRRV
jgi:hypothetical protein